MAIDFATFLNVAPHILNSKLPVLIRGRHGVGKSEVVYQIAARRDLPVIERRASQMTEGDLLGLPDVAETSINGRKATTWNAPDWLVTACEQPVLLFLDEVDRATQEVRQGLFELTDSRKINGWHLHADTLIVAAVNGGEHGAQYQVGEMDPAELDRWTVFDVEPSTEDWLKWAMARCQPLFGTSLTTIASTLSTKVTLSLTRFTRHVVHGSVTATLLSVLVSLKKMVTGIFCSTLRLRSLALRLRYHSATSLRSTNGK